MAVLGGFSMSNHMKQQGRKSGVALVIVLALLALLMIVCASFLFTMRIERAGASNNRYDWVAGQVAHAGLDYALASIDHFFLNSTEENPGWHDGDSAYWEYDSDKRVFKLHADTFVSLREDLSDNLRRHAAPANRFIPLGSKAASFLPPALAYRGSASKLILDPDGRGPEKIDPPEWIPVRPFGALDADSVSKGGGEDGSSDRNPVIGRYAFMAFDTTGMVDVNRVMTNGSERAWGQDPGEIQLDYKTFAADFRASRSDNSTLKEKNVLDFMDVRDQDGAYVSLQDMAALNEHFDPSFSRHLKTLSYEPPWPAWTNAAEVVDLSESTGGKLSGRIQDLEDAFFESGLTEEQAFYAARGLIDYVDEDWEPYGADDDEKFCRPATEPMPLMAGGVGRVRVIAWQTARTFTNTVIQADGSVKTTITAGPDPENSSYRIAVEGVVPFSWMYDAPGEMSGAYDQFDLKGRISAWEMGTGVREDRDNAEFFRKLLPDGLEDGIRLSENAGDCDNRLVKDFGFGSVGHHANTGTDKKDLLPVTLNLAFRFAGETLHNGKTTRRYPVKGDWYDDESMAIDTWMAADINTRFPGYKVEFKEVEGAAKRKELVPDDLRRVKWNDPVTGKSKTETVSCKTWMAEVVTWAEVFDPRYAYKGMAEENDGDMPSQLHFTKGLYRTSHPSFDRRGAPGGVDEASILELCDMFPEFNGLKARVHDFAENANEEVDIMMMLDNYFDEGSFHFCPVASWIMQHPDIPMELMNIHMDGVRLGAYEDSIDEKRALWRAYVKNAPVESAGELGYLPIGPWLTVRLYDYNEEKVADPRALKANSQDNRIPGYDGYLSDYPGFHTVLDHFAIEPERARPGRISVDSSEIGVLSSVFNQLPVSKTREGPVAVDEKNAKVLAEIVMALRKGVEVNMPRLGGGKHLQSLSKASDFGKLFYPIPDVLSADYHGGYEIACRDEEDQGCMASKALFNILDGQRGTYLGEFEREALVAKSYNLFTNRGKSFLIVVKAQAYTPGFFKTAIEDETGSIHASRTLIVEVWRDTVDENKDGVYPWKIVSVTVLDE